MMFKDIRILMKKIIIYFAIKSLTKQMMKNLTKEWK